MHHTKNVWEKHVSRIVIGSGAEGSFSLAVRRSVFDSEERETPCRGKAGAVLPVNGLAKKSWKRGRKRFLAALEMTAWGMAIPYIIQRMCGKRVLPVSSSRAESRGLFRWRQEGECLTARNGKHRIAERRSVMAIKKRGDPSFFIYFDGSPSSSCSSPTVSAIASAPW